MIFISNILSGSGELFWADVRLEEVDDSIPVTDMFKDHKRGGPKTAPSNLDFAEA